MNQHTENAKFTHWLKHSSSSRMLIIGVLIALLLTPLTLIKNLINERALNQDKVIQEINNRWGGKVLLYGPILKIPYHEYKEKSIYNQTTKKHYIEKTKHLSYAYFFPDQLNISGNVEPEEKYYGIYKTAVYRSPLILKGAFSTCQFDKEISPGDILWSKASILIKTTNLKGVNNRIEIELNQKKHALTSNYQENSKACK